MRARVCLDRQFILEELPRLTTSEIRVLLCLHLHHSAERGCWPSVKAIAGLTGLHRGSVHAAIASLQEKKLIRIERVDGKPCYWLPVSERNVLQGGVGKWGHQVEVSPYDDNGQGEVSPYEDEVSPYEDEVSPYEDSGCHQETTVPRVPRAGASAHAPNEVSIERTKEVAPPPAAGVCASAPGEPDVPTWWPTPQEFIEGDVSRVTPQTIGGVLDETAAERRQGAEQ
jgi:hypothetical protein